MVASAHYLASQAGTWMLRQGGNAVDAAVCAAATIAVVAPHLNGVGGDLFAQVWLPTETVPVGLNASGRAGSRATIELVRSLGHERIPDRGPLAITVPGAVSGWQALLRRFGTRRLFEILEPAIDYADNGAPVTRGIARAIRASITIVLADEGMRHVFTRDGVPRSEGEIFSNRDLAASLREIAATDGESMYRGDLALRVTEGVRRAGGLLEVDDLARHTADWVSPISTGFGGLEIFELPPNTQGVTALELLNMAELLGLAGLAHNSAMYVHRLVSAIQPAYQDRDGWVTDPDFADIPVARLSSKAHAESRLHNPAPATPITADGDTIYLCVVDGSGMAVSLIQSNYMGFGSGIMAEGTGIHLHNRGTLFSLDPEHANRLAPRKRTMHTLIPALGLRGGRLDLVFGTMGGDAQPQIQLQMLLNHLVFGMEVQAAIESPRFTYSSASDGAGRILLEARFPESAVAELRHMGHDVEVVEDWSSLMGHAQAIRVDRETALKFGAADPRGDSAALGY